MRRRWLFGAAVLVGAWLFIFLYHRRPANLLFDQAWVIWNLLPLPFSVEGMHEAIRWQMTVHTPQVSRPVRAIFWWLATVALGCGPTGYYVLNGLTLGAATWAAWLLAGALTESRRRALVVALGVAVTYAGVLPLVYIGYAQPALCGYLGLAAWFCAEAGGTRWRWPLRGAAVVLILLAALMHETYLAYALVPVLHAIVVRRTRPAVAGALAFLAVLPAYTLARSIRAQAYRSSESWLSRVLEGIRETPDVLIENPGRVLFSVLTGGLPLDPLRALPWFPEFVRIREMMLSPAGIATMAVVLVPTLALGSLALAAARDDVAARRRTVFYLLWLAAGSLPLMLPVGTPESMHLVGVLPALFLLWSEGFASRAGRAALVAASVLLAVWTGVHLGARWILFHRDIPAMSRAVQALHSVFLDAPRAGARAAVLFVPVQIGGHYGMLPSVPALYQDGSGGCARADRPGGCLVEPVWIWSTLRPSPSLPRACRTADGLRVGPINGAAERELEGSRRMLGHSTVSLTKPVPPALMSPCPLRATSEERNGGARYRVYRLDVGSSDGSRILWYRFNPDGDAALEPVGACAPAS